jgi:hypothetical protein
MRYPIALAALLLLAACTPRTEVDLEGKQAIECMIPGQSDFELACTIERSQSPDGTVLTVRAPDGEFRRFLIVRDGRGVIAADGAETVKVTPAGSDSIDVLAGEIVYRLPAKVTA